jgi:arsenate reductase-like glutaredoxin family protein
LIADNLGWFEDSSTNIEEIMKRNGEEYKKLNVEGIFQLSTNDEFVEIKDNKKE